MNRRKYGRNADVSFGVVVAFWVVSLVLALAFWGGVAYVVYRILVHFGIL